MKTTVSLPFVAIGLIMFFSAISAQQFVTTNAPPHIGMQLSADGKTINFICTTGPTCPVRFGGITVSDGTPHAGVTIASIPIATQALYGDFAAFFLTSPAGSLRVGGDIAVTCGTLVACTQNNQPSLSPGEILIGSANADPIQGKWVQLRDGWTGAQAFPVINIVTLPGVTDPNTPFCWQAYAAGSVTVTCQNP